MNTHDRLAIRGTFYILLSIFGLIVFAFLTGTPVTETRVTDSHYDEEKKIWITSIEDDDTGRVIDLREGRPNLELEEIKDSVIEEVLARMTFDEISEAYEVQPDGYTILKQGDNITLVIMEQNRVKKIIKTFKEVKTKR